MAQYEFPYKAAYLPGFEDGAEFVVGQRGVKSVGLAPCPVPGFFFLVVEMKAEEGETTMRRFMCNPSTVVLECGEPKEVPDIVIPQSQVPTDLVAAR